MTRRIEKKRNQLHDLMVYYQHPIVELTTSTEYRFKTKSTDTQTVYSDNNLFDRYRDLIDFLRVLRQAKFAVKVAEQPHIRREFNYTAGETKFILEYDFTVLLHESGKYTEEELNFLEFFSD